MKRYIGNTGEVYIVEDTVRRPVEDRDWERREVNTPKVHNEPPAGPTTANTSNSFFGNLFSASNRSVRQKSNLPFDLDMGDLAILALLFFLYWESGDEEFLIILAFFAFSILTK